MQTVLKSLALLTLVVGLPACVHSPSLTRASHPTFFVLQAEATVPRSAMQDVADCLHDGFARSHYTFTNIKPTIIRRVEGFRVESRTNNIVGVSVDVLETGAVEFHERKHSSLIDFSGERQAFTTCVEANKGAVTRPFSSAQR